MTVIDARERLVEMTINSYSQMTKDGRRKLYRDTRKRAYPEHLEKKMDFDEFARRMGVVNGGKASN